MKKKEISRAFHQAYKKAEEIINQRDKLYRLIGEATEKALKQQERLKNIKRDLDALIELARAYAAGEYRRLPWKSILMVVAAIIYFVNPFDIIPDFLGVLGFVDDATVIGLVANALREEVERFRIYSNRTY